MVQKHLIWDLPLRLFHWCFAITVFASWYTSGQENEYIEYHMQLGYFALGLLTFRILWGIIGPKHARFRQFVPSPRQLFHYINGLKQGQNQHSPGHNPLGSLMVLMMISLITLQAISGLFISDDIFSSGPYYGSMSSDVEKLMSILHHNVFDYMLFSIALHFLAIGYYWKVKKQNLILPMINGKKSSDTVSAADSINSSKLGLAFVLAVITAVFIYWLVVINAPVIEEFYY